MTMEPRAKLPAEGLSKLAGTPSGWKEFAVTRRYPAPFGNVTGLYVHHMPDELRAVEVWLGSERLFEVHRDHVVLGRNLLPDVMVEPPDSTPLASVRFYDLYIVERYRACTWAHVRAYVCVAFDGAPAEYTDKFRLCTYRERPRDEHRASLVLMHGMAMPSHLCGPTAPPFEPVPYKAPALKGRA